jgi:hypothetical protein
MSKPVTPQEMFDLWQKMVNPGAYPLQSLMFPVPDSKEIEKKIAELEVVEHWLKANLNMLQLTTRTLQYQLAMLKGGEKASEVMRAGLDAEKAPRAAASENPAASKDPPNPAMWAWNMMADATTPKDAAKKTKKRR